MRAKIGYFLILVVIVAAFALQGCTDAENWPDDPEATVDSVENLDSLSQPLIGTWYDAGSRSIYAKATSFRGTPNVKITTRSALNNACRTTGPVVMNRIPPAEITRTICSNLGLVYRLLNGGVKACYSSTTNTQVTVMKYNYTSATQRQLNYVVFDWNGQRALDVSGWQPPAPGNGCARSIP